MDDVVSESFQKAFAKLASFDTSRELRPWLATIATRTALDHLASIKREDQKKAGIVLTSGDSASEAQDPLTEVTPEEEIINGENHERLMAFIEDEGHRASEDLAKERGPFPAYPDSVFPARGAKPLRNATVTTIAPTAELLENNVIAITWADENGAVGYAVINPTDEDLTIELPEWKNKKIQMHLF